MNARTSILLLCGAVAIGAMVHCGGSSPTQPPSGGGGPTTTTTTTTTTTQPAGIVLPVGMVCSPTPPPLYGISVKLWGKVAPYRGIIDTYPQVLNVNHYCRDIGAGDNKFCPTRLEGDAQRVACDYLAMGKASDTGRWGPTWDFNGEPCAPPGGSGDCMNHDDNQFKVIAKASGRYEACAAPNAIVDPEQGSRCGSVTIQMPIF